MSSRLVPAFAAFCLSGLACLSPCLVAAQAAAPEPAAAVRVAIPNDHNLQWMNFWVAIGAGYFADEGLDVQVVLPRSVGGEGRGGVGGGGGGAGGGGAGGGGGGGGAGDAGSGGGDGEADEGLRAVETLLSGSADFAVLPRPIFLIAVSEARPVLAVANLLANDPINLVVQGDIAEERGLSPEAPLADRLGDLRGLRVGVAGGPITRLRALLAVAGMNADTDIEMVVVQGAMQNAAFAERRFDALFAHTPFLETALTEQGAVLLVNLSAGEVPELAGRQIHQLVTTRESASRRPDLVLAMTRAIYRAQQLIHSDREATLTAIRASGVRLQAPDALDRIVEIYAPAIPGSPAVSAEGAARELALFPARRALPDVSGVAIEDFVDNRFAMQAIAGE